MNGVVMLVLGGMFHLAMAQAVALTGDSASTLSPSDARQVWRVKSGARSHPAPTYYKVVGVYKNDKTAIGPNAVAALTEQVELEMWWPMDDQHPPRPLLNVSTRVDQLRDPAGKCSSPTLKGRLEYFELKSIQDMGSMLELRGERRIPDLNYHQFGEGGCRGPQSAKEEVSETGLLLMLPMELFTGQAGADQVLHTSGEGWSWTFTPLP